MAAAPARCSSADGLILTNYHLVEEVVDNPEEKDAVVIGVTLDPRQPARELFRGNVLAYDKKIDLALVQIACGLYHQPLPEGYRFPSDPAGRSGCLGDRRQGDHDRLSGDCQHERPGERDVDAGRA